MSLTHGITIIKKHLEAMPTSPGVYQMLDADGKVLYVGKAKNLAKRVVSYTHPERAEYRIQTMVSHVAAMEIITTRTEAEALLLESNLIKKHEPRYNILLKDGKTYPYILMTGDHAFPRITKHRGPRKLKGQYYGPFASAGSVNKVLADIQKAFLLRPCSDSYFANRDRPCMEYQIKRCSAPCVGKVSQNEYASLVGQAQDFLQGKSREIQAQLVTLMEQESAAHHYEKAAVYRDRIKALNAVQARQTISVTSVQDADIIGIAQEGGQCCVQVFFFRSGQHFGNQPFFPKNTDGQSEADILGAFLGQFYQENTVPPREILVSVEVSDGEFLQEYFSDSTGYKVQIACPKRGDKLKLVENAVRNAHDALQQKLLGKARQTDILEKIAEIFGLQAPPKRIEVYDNSHISGQHDVGAMIVAGEEGFNKKAYRRFNIRDMQAMPGDDYAMMTQVLMRRFQRLKQETPDQQAGIWPDLVLIDGGAGHLSVVTRVFEQLGLMDKLVFACISKGPDRNAGREQFHMPGREAFTLPHNDPAMYYLQNLRDEAHRFAIGSHRKRRATSVTKSAIDAIPGIGPKRKKLLLNHFGSADGIREATLEELMAVEGFNKAMAELVYGYFR